MDTATYAGSVTGLSKHRIEALTDGIYAIVMTLAVLSIDVSELPSWASPETILPALTTILPQFLHFTVAFFILAAFWVGYHQQFHYISHVDRRYIWITMTSLFLIALIPFSTALAGDFSQSPFAVQVFAFNMFLIGVANVAGWRYASRNHRLLHDEVTTQQIIHSDNLGMVIPVFALCSVFLAFAISSYAFLIFVFIPVIQMAISRMRTFSMKIR